MRGTLPGSGADFTGKKHISVLAVSASHHRAFALPARGSILSVLTSMYRILTILRKTCAGLLLKHSFENKRPCWWAGSGHTVKSILSPRTEVCAFVTQTLNVS